jgi:predicted Zn-dependent protease
LAAAPRYAHAHVIKGRVLSAQNRWEEAILEYETALALNRNSAAALQGLGQCKLLAGPIEEAIPLEEHAIRLSPRDPYIGYPYFVIGTVHLLQSRTDEAIAWLKKARIAMLAVPIVRSALASAYALRGETERAAAELAEARSLNGGDLFSSIARVKSGWGMGGAEDPRLVRSHIFCGAAQGRDAGGMTATRRLAAILAADVAGYSRLIGADEGGTLQALKVLSLVRPHRAFTRCTVPDPTLTSRAVFIAAGGLEGSSRLSAGGR